MAATALRYLYFSQQTFSNQIIMKFFVLGAALAVASLTACNNQSGTSSSTTTQSDTPAAAAAIAPYTPPAGVDASVSNSLKPVVTSYLKLKNALAGDDGKAAAAAGNDILAALNGVNTGAMTAAQKGVYDGLLADIREHAEHTSSNSGNIAHQREHFEMLSKDVYDLVKTFGGGQKLYYAHCPMAFDNKGASWVSESEKIRNPYFGDEMLECGEVKEELK